MVESDKGEARGSDDGIQEEKKRERKRKKNRQFARQYRERITSPIELLSNAHSLRALARKYYKAHVISMTLHSKLSNNAGHNGDNNYQSAISTAPRRLISASRGNLSNA
jgi:hypothetical protein